jgi:uncharacterized protein
MIKVRSIAPEEVNVAGIAARPGTAIQTRLPVPGLAPEHLPCVTIVAGTDPGPVVTVVSGVHGCEISSIEAGRRLSHRLEGSLRCGTVLVVPVANLAGFFARTLYFNPTDGKNLNRSFPGSADGTASERLAHAMMTHLVEPADVVFDLHGGDSVEALDPFMMAERPPGQPLNASALEMAECFGIDQVISGHVPGSMIGEAARLGKAALLAESGQQGILSELAAQRLSAGVENVLARLDMTEPRLSRPDVLAAAPARPVFRPGWTWVTSEHAGFWLLDPAVTCGREVTEGALVGTIRPLERGGASVEVRTPHAGRIIFLVTSLSTSPGTPLYAIAQPGEPWPIA